MDKKESFKEFAKHHPELIEHVKNNSMTWQKFYEMYDIYGEDENIWKDYIRKNNTSFNAEELTKKIKNIDMNSIEEHIKTAQKALSIVSELTTKSASSSEIGNTVPKVPRPINKFFED